MKKTNKLLRIKHTKNINPAYAKAPLSISVDRLNRRRIRLATTSTGVFSQTNFDLLANEKFLTAKTVTTQRNYTRGKVPLIALVPKCSHN